MYNGASQFALFYAIISINSVTIVLTLKIPKKEKVYFKCPDDALNHPKKRSELSEL